MCSKFIKLVVLLSLLVCCGFAGRVLYSRFSQLCRTRERSTSHHTSTGNFSMTLRKVVSRPTIFLSGARIFLPAYKQSCHQGHNLFFQIILARGHSCAKVSFHPYTEKPSGEQCTGYVAAYMSLDDQVMRFLLTFFWEVF